MIIWDQESVDIERPSACSKTEKKQAGQNRIAPSGNPRSSKRYRKNLVLPVLPKTYRLRYKWENIKRAFRGRVSEKIRYVLGSSRSRTAPRAWTHSWGTCATATQQSQWQSSTQQMWQLSKPGVFFFFQKPQKTTQEMGLETGTPPSSSSQGLSLTGTGGPWVGRQWHGAAQSYPHQNSGFWPCCFDSHWMFFWEINSSRRMSITVKKAFRHSVWFTSLPQPEF